MIQTPGIRASSGQLAASPKLECDRHLHHGQLSTSCRFLTPESPKKDEKTNFNTLRKIRKLMNTCFLKLINIQKPHHNEIVYYRAMFQIFNAKIFATVFQKLYFPVKSDWI